MIRINIAKKIEVKFREIYLQPIFNAEMFPATEKESLIDRLQREIASQLTDKEPQDAHLIVATFLKRHFGNDPNDISQAKIIEYLLCRDLKTIIHTFWQCVSLVWSAKLKQKGVLADSSDTYAEILSQWSSLKEKAMDERDKTIRAKLVRKVITMETLPFFQNIKLEDITSRASRGTVISNTDRLREVKFRFDDDLYADDTGAISILSKIFDYDLLNGEPRHKLLTAMEIPVCPYCNRQYITSYPEAGHDKTTADLDHYFCKSLYPYLALSLYNFVPSCQICNSRFKLAKDFYTTPHLYPYESDSTSEVRFRLGDDRLLFDDSAWNEPEISFLEIEATDEAARNSIETFHLKDVYQSHKDYVYEIIWKIRMYSDDLIEILHHQFSTHQVSETGEPQKDIQLFDGTRDIRDLVFGQYLDEREVHKRPLAKLTQDIMEDSNSWTWLDEDNL